MAEHTVEQDLVRGAEPPIRVGTPEWFAWLGGVSAFAYHTPGGAITLRREQKGGGSYWYAYRSHGGRLAKRYLGKDARLTAEHLRDTAAALHAQARPVAQLSLFGAPRLLLGGQPAALPPAKALGLIAYLAASERPVSREHLLALFWPESGAEAARKNMRNLLWRLRASLGAAFVQGDHALELGTSAWVDVRQFEQAERAAEAETRSRSALQTQVRLYHGGLLDGVAFEQAADFELWLSGARQHYAEQHQRAIAALIALGRERGNWAEIVRLARNALAEDPLRESAHRALMEAQAQLGDRAAAVRQYALLRTVLQRELGVDPLPETETLRTSILRGSLLPGPSVSTAPQATRLHTLPFVGRVAELATLDRALDTSSTGRAQAVLLQGEPGIGKTQLWQVWAGQLGNSVRVLETRCLSTTEHIPFAPLVALLRSAPFRQRLAAQPAARWRSELARLVPDLLAPAGDTALPPVPSLPAIPLEERRRLFEALVQSLALDPATPLVLHVDDIHWADAATLEWLGYLMHRAESLPLLLVAAHRDTPPNPPMAQLLAEWAREGVLTRLPLQRLSREETSILVSALHGNIQRIEELYQRSDGNPLFIAELLRAAPGSLPTALTDLIAGRLAHLSGVAQQVLQAAAILQPEIDPFLLQHTSGRSEEETLEALDTMILAGVLAEHEGRYQFAHPLIAQTVERGMSKARRTILHRRAADAWARLDPRRNPAVAGRLAWHYQEAGRTEQAAQYAELAGDHALAVAAPAEAAHFYQQALDLAPTPCRMFGLGRALYLRNNLPEARATFERAFAAYEQAGDHSGAARASFELARSFLSVGDADAVIHWVRLGQAHLVDKPDQAAQALAALLLGAELRARGQNLDQAAAQLEEALALAGETAPNLVSSILMELGNVRAQQGDLPAAIASYQELTARAVAGEDILNQAFGHNNTAYHALLAGDLALAHAEAEQALRLAEGYDLGLVSQWVFSTLGEIALAEGKTSLAEQWFHRGNTLAVRYANRELQASYRANLGLALRARGDLAGAIAALEQAHAETLNQPVPFLRVRLDLLLAETYQQAGEAAAARLALGRAEQQLVALDYGQLRHWAAVLREQLEK